MSHCKTESMSPAPAAKMLGRNDLLSHLKGFMSQRLSRSRVGTSEPRWMPEFVSSVEEMMSDNGMLPAKHRGLVFESLAIPPVRISDYCWLLWVGFGAYGCGTGLWVTALALLKRFISTGHTPLTRNTLHRLVLVAVTTAAKLVDDLHPSNKVAAALGGVDMHNMNQMERRFYEAVNYQLCVSQDQHNAVVSRCLRGDPSLKIAPILTAEAHHLPPAGRLSRMDASSSSFSSLNSSVSSHGLSESTTSLSSAASSMRRGSARGMSPRKVPLFSKIKAKLTPRGTARKVAGTATA